MKEQRYSDHEIIYMQVRLYHLACEKWDATPKEILAIFKKNNLLNRILNCAVAIEISVKAFTSHLLTFKHDDLLKHL